MITIGIVLLNWNGKENTLSCLSSLRKLSTKGFSVKIVVVDNGSTDDSVKIISEKFSEAHIIENHNNLGFAKGCNVGTLFALKNDADFVVLLNNDTIVHSHLLVELFGTYDAYKNVGAVSPKIYFEKGFEFHKNRYDKKDFGKVLWYAGGIMDWKNVIGRHRGVDEVDKGQFDVQEETDFASGCCMMLPRKVLQTVGLFDEKYFLYYEDSDLSMRIKKNGYKILYCPKAVLWHKNAGSSGSGSDLQDYYITRNRLVFGFRFAPLRTKFSLFRESIRLWLQGRIWQRYGVRDFYLRKFYKGSYNK